MQPHDAMTGQGVHSGRFSGTPINTSKVKDGPTPHDLRFRMDTVKIDAGSNTSDAALTSCRLTPVRLMPGHGCRRRETPTPGPQDGLDDRSRAILQALRGDFDASTAPTSRALQKACGVPRTSFYEHLGRLVEDDNVESRERGVEVLRD